MNSFGDFKHSVPTSGMGQKTYEQCWLASYTMMYSYYKQPVGGIEGKLSGKGIDVADAKTMASKTASTVTQARLWE